MRASYALFGCSPSAGGYIGGCNAWAGEGNSECAKQRTSAACEAKECYWVTRGGTAQCLSTGGLDANAQDGPAVRNEIQRRVMQSTRLKIPASFYGETTHCGGARGTTVFPMPCSQGASWNTTLVGAIAAANALELRSAGGDQALSPILQVATDPRFGRLEGARTVCVCVCLCVSVCVCVVRTRLNAHAHGGGVIVGLTGGWCRRKLLGGPVPCRSVRCRGSERLAGRRWRARSVYLPSGPDAPRGKPGM
eukprot:COSAG03_NODE_4022_length_1718_cov_1.779494_2_plen_250_part_00